MTRRRFQILLVTLLIAATNPTGSKSEEPVTTAKKPTEISVSSLEAMKVIGPLGEPLGKAITVTVVMQERERKGYLQWVSVTHVNGVLLKEPVKLAVEEGISLEEEPLEKVPAKQVRHYRAYQTITYMGLPTEVNEELGGVQDYNFHLRSILVVYRKLDRP